MGKFINLICLFNFGNCLVRVVLIFELVNEYIDIFWFVFLYVFKNK